MYSTAPLPMPFARRRFSRNTVVVGSVLAFHVVALWALQSGLVRKVVDVIVPVEMLTVNVEPPKPAPAPPPPKPVKQAVAKAKAPVLAPAPQLMAIADPTPSPNAPTGVTTPQPPAPPLTEPVATAPPAPPAAPPAPPKITLPSSDADYLHNPKPPYPALSKRLGEQGTARILVLVKIDGTAKQAEIKQSSGFDRLDQAALNAALKWRYVPGSRNGVPEESWVIVPMPFVLE